MDGRMIFWLMVYSFAIFIKVSKEQSEKYPGCLEKSLVGKERKINIPDSSYKASSYYKSSSFNDDDRYVPRNAKLYGKYGWAPEKENIPDDYLQIDFGTLRVITAVATQGNGGDPDSLHYRNIYEWVTSYNLSFANNTKSWKRYGQKVKGNYNQTNVVRHEFKTPIIAQHIRFIPLEYISAKTMRVNVYVSTKLQAPPSITVKSFERSIRIKWTIKTCSATNPITAFKVKIGSKMKIMHSNETRSYTGTNLKPFTVYHVSVGAETPNGSTWSEVKKIRTLVAVPEIAPNYTTAGPTSSETIQLEWTISQPDKINGPLKGYNITYRPEGGQTKTIDVGNVTRFTLTKLLTYTTYVITIAVYNGKYTGPSSKELRVRTSEDVPEVSPTYDFTRPTSSESIQLAWKISQLDKINGPLKGYRIDYTPEGGKTKTVEVGNVTTYTLKSLLKYTNYSINIAVDNGKYTGPPSNERRVRTMEDAPSAPMNVRGTLQKANGLLRPRVLITWDKPSDPNGIIRNYTIIYHYDNGASNKILVTPKAGITHSHNYTVTVMSSGTFSYSISASTIKKGLYATWQSIIIPKYKCPERSLVGENRLAIPKSHYNASSQYDERYAPFNATLNGPYGWAPKDNNNPDDYLQIDLGTPRVITAVATQGNGNTVKKEWVEKYKIYYKSQMSNYSGGTEFKGNTDSSSVVRHDLENPITAKYIKFVPTKYHGNKTMRVNVYASFQEAPRITSVDVSERSITLRWTIKPCCPTHHITEYEVKLADTTKPYVEFTNTSELTMYNLKPYTKYNVSIRAVKQVGYGVWSNVTSTRTAIAKPEEVPFEIKVAERTSQSISLQWKLEHVDLINGPFKGYVIEYTPQGGETKTDEVFCKVVKKCTTHTLTLLRKYTPYSFRVAVMNERLKGPFSTEQHTRTMQAKPNRSPAITTMEPLSSTSILLKWKKVDRVEMNGPFKAYRIFYKRQGRRRDIIDVGDSAIFNLTSLFKYTIYSVTIAVMNEKFVGPKSTELSRRTLEDAPSAPINVNGTLIPAQDSFGPRVVITWERPREPNGIIRKYTIVYYYNQATSSSKTVIINGTIDLQYIMNVTTSGVLSFKIRATTIKEGPYQMGNNIEVPSDRKGTFQKNTQGGSAASGLVAGLVVGIILIILFLVLLILIWKRKRTHHGRYEAAEPLPLEVVDDSPSSTTGNSSFLQETAPEIGPLVFRTEMERHRSLRRPSYRSASVKSIKRPIEFPAPDINKLKKEFKSMPVEPRFDCKEGTKSANKVKNRYKNIIAYDHSLVTLEWVYGDSESFYINANYIHGYDGSSEVYIATQGPLDNTLSDFWRMIWEQNVSSIIMLTNLQELGKKKCYQYWPDNCDQYSDITITNHKTEVFADFTIRTFFLSKAGSQNRRVRQFHFTAWPDKGVPDHATAVLSFRRKLLALSSSDNSRPTVVHCSAGVGRTGTYIMIDAMLRQAEEQQHVDIFDYLKTIRNDRPYMVQTVEQYIFVNIAIYDALTCGNTEVPVQNLLYAIQQLSIVDRRHKLTGYALEFQRLEDVTSEDIQSGNFDVGLSRKNVKKNRYPSIVAANGNRVILNTENDTEIGDYINSSVIEAYKERKGDYINASFVDTYREHNAFIMTQAPMENTIVDFWRMVMDYKIGTIVMLNNSEEEREVFPQYWPLHEAKTYDSIKVRLVETKHLAGNIILRILKVSNRKKQLTVNHFQHLTWENKCVPTNPQSVLKLLHEVQTSQQKSGNSPIVVQCSNGVGRSGTFCAIASCLERVKQEQVLDVFQTIKSIRVNRPGAVETLAQYVFCYNIIQKYLDSFRDYANFGDI